MKSGWIGGMTNSTEATVKLGENFSKFIDLPTSRHFFLLTKKANFLSRIPSFSLG